MQIPRAHFPLESQSQEEGTRSPEFCLVFLRFYLYFVGIDVLPACVSMCYLYTWCLGRPEESAVPLEPKLQMVVNYQMGAGT